MMEVRLPYDVSRRWFVAALGGSAILSGFLPSHANALVPLGVKDGPGYSPTVWYVIGSDGHIVVHIALAEMGQHVGTALALLVAEELEANWNDIEIVHVDSDPKWGYQVTGGSWSVNHSYLTLSRAGAAGRIALVEAGARLLGMTADNCSARNSAVSSGAKSISFGEIVSSGVTLRSFTEDDLKRIQPKPAADRRLLGHDIKARDIPRKVNGQALYAIDRRVEGMAYARPIVPPTRYGNKIASWSDAKAKSVPGYLRTVQIEDPSDICQGWLVAVASSWPAASRAADLVDVTYNTGPAIDINEERLLAEGARLLDDPTTGTIFVQSGDVDAVFKGADDVLEATYRTGSVLQMQMEPVNALAWQDGEKWHIHAGDQQPSNSRLLVAKALGVDSSKVVIEASYLGGGFGRRLYGDFMVPAALTAKAIGRPVKLVFSRPDDVKFATPRSPTVQRIRTVADKSGRLRAYDYAGAAGWPTYVQTPNFLEDGVGGKGKVDAFAISGADHWYDSSSQRIRTIRNELVHVVFLPGYLRSVAPGYTCWAVETHIDELAHKLGRDPVDYRSFLLGAEGRNAGEGPNDVGGARRLKAVLERAAQKADWANRGSLPKGEGMGIALGGGQERTMPTWSATVAHVAVDRATGTVSVKRLISVVDAGTLVHPDGAHAQIEGGVLWGLSIALFEGTQCEKGRARDLNYDTYTPVRMADVPSVDIEFMVNDYVPVGLGEPGVITVAPAIGNAIFHAVGARVRDLPIRPQAVLKAMEA
jgi:CO/xanthine dehydrogenase Mo-binding subunit